MSVPNVSVGKTDGHAKNTVVQIRRHVVNRVWCQRRMINSLVNVSREVCGDVNVPSTHLVRIVAVMSMVVGAVMTMISKKALPARIRMNVRPSFACNPFVTPMKKVLANDCLPQNVGEPWALVGVIKAVANMRQRRSPSVVYSPSMKTKENSPKSGFSRRLFALQRAKKHHRRVILVHRSF